MALTDNGTKWRVPHLWSFDDNNVCVYLYVCACVKVRGAVLDIGSLLPPVEPGALFSGMIKSKCWCPA